MTGTQENWIDVACDCKYVGIVATCSLFNFDK